ncbi:MAG: hypothetical protein AB8G86_01120 [Saprospiraceae bacterium]
MKGRNEDLLIRGTKIALAICYEISVPKHIAAATKNGAKIYLASVAKTQEGVQQAAERLSLIAKNYKGTGKI